MALTDVICRATAAGSTRQKLSDGGGLQLWIQPTGSRLWQFAYRYQGKQKQLALGPYPEVSLKQAREKRTDARRLIREGIDPASHWRATVQDEEQAETFKSIALEYIEKRRRESLASPTMVKKEWLLGMAYPALGNKKMTDIRPIDVLKVLQDIEARGCYETARRVRSTVGAVFRYAVATARGDTDPTSALKGAITTPKATPRAAITNSTEFGGLLRAIDDFAGQATTRAALKLMALLFPRPGELRTAQWVEFNFEKAVWTIPASKTKMRREHRLPLPPQALTVLKELESINGHRELVFPAIHNWRRPMSENTLNLALRRLGYGQDEMCSHGFRATASTLLNESGLWNPDAIERQLAHMDHNSVRRAYARGEHWEERVKMAVWWADHLDALRRDSTALRTKETH